MDTVAASVETTTQQQHQQDWLQAEGVTYLFGTPIAHSWSPLLHNTLYAAQGLPWRYRLFESSDVPAFLARLRDPRCRGASVTMPNKLAVAGHLDELTAEGRDVGACNTVYFRRDPATGHRLLVGTNTDVVGIREALARNVDNVYEMAAGRPGLVVGGGGAARSAAYVLDRWFKCSRVYIVNRDAAEVEAVRVSCRRGGFGGTIEHVATVERARELAAETLTGGGAPVVAVGCVPDFPPATEAERQAREVLCVLLEGRDGSRNGDNEYRGALLEMAYHPRVHTALAALARDRRWRVVLGTEAVLWQGMEQHRLWTGAAAHNSNAAAAVDATAVQACKDAFAAALERTVQPARAQL